MELKQRALSAVSEIEGIAGVRLSSEQRNAVDRIIEDLVIEAMRECEASYGHAARNCCSGDQDMAHKIADEIRRARQALIANLSALR